MILHTVVLLLLLLGETSGAAAAAAVETSSSSNRSRSSSWRLLAGLLVLRPRTSTAEPRSCCLRRVAVQTPTPSRLTAANCWGGSPLACSLPSVAEPTHVYPPQQQQQQQAGLAETPSSGCLFNFSASIVSPQPPPQRRPPPAAAFFESTGIAVTAATPRRLCSITPLAQVPSRQWPLLPRSVSSTPALRQHPPGTAATAAFARVSRVRATAAVVALSSVAAPLRRTSLATQQNIRIPYTQAPAACRSTGWGRSIAAQGRSTTLHNCRPAGLNRRSDSGAAVIQKGLAVHRKSATRAAPERYSEREGVKAACSVASAAAVAGGLSFLHVHLWASPTLSRTPLASFAAGGPLLPPSRNRQSGLQWPRLCNANSSESTGDSSSFCGVSSSSNSSSRCPCLSTYPFAGRGGFSSCLHLKRRSAVWRTTLCCSSSSNSVSTTGCSTGRNSGDEKKNTLDGSSTKNNTRTLHTSGSSSAVSDSTTGGDGGSVSFDYVCLTSPEAARVFSTCWRDAGCPPIPPDMLVCVGDGTRAAAEKALAQDLQLHLGQQQQQSVPQYNGCLYPLVQLDEQQQRNNRQKKQRQEPEEEENKEQEHRQQCRGKLTQLTHAAVGTHPEYGGRAPSAPDHELSAKLEAPVSATTPTKSVSTGGAAAVRPCAHPRPRVLVSSRGDIPAAVSTAAELCSPAEAAASSAPAADTRPAADEADASIAAATADAVVRAGAQGAVVHGGGASAAAGTAAANAARADGGWETAGAAGGIEMIEEAPGAATASERRLSCEGVTDSAWGGLQQAFLSFRPSSSSASVLAAELPPRPPLLRHLLTALGTVSIQQPVQQPQQQHDEVQYLVERACTAIFRGREHAHPGCTYTPAEAVVCAVQLLHQEKEREVDRDMKEILLPRCCPCWLQTRVVWPASALARPTLQKRIQERPLQQLAQHSFAAVAAVPSALRVRLRVLPIQQTEDHVSSSPARAALKQYGDLTAAGAPGLTAVHPLAAPVVEPLTKEGRTPAAATSPATTGGGAVASSPLLESSAARDPAEEGNAPAASRLFQVERYTTYTTTQVMLTAAERRAVLQRMQEVFGCSKRCNRVGTGGDGTSRRPTKDSSITSSSPTPGNVNRDRTSENLESESRSVDDTGKNLERHIRSNISSTLVRSTSSSSSTQSNYDSRGSSRRRSSAASSSLNTRDPMNTRDASDRSTAAAGGNSKSKEAAYTAGETATAAGKEEEPRQGLVIVILASPSAVWSWTGNGLPVSVAECCAERQLPSYTAVHAGTKHERPLRQRLLSSILLQEGSSGPRTGSGDTSSRRVNTSYARNITRNMDITVRGSGQRSSSIRDTSDDSSSSCGHSSSSSGSSSENGSIVCDDNSATGSGGTSDKNGANTLKLPECSATRRMEGLMDKEGGDAHFVEAEDFVLLLQNCQKIIQEGRKQREQEERQRKPGRLLALCIGPTTASAAKQAGFSETMEGECGSVAALADLVEACAVGVSHCEDSFSEGCTSSRAGQTGPNGGKAHREKSTTGALTSSSGKKSCSERSTTFSETVHQPPAQSYRRANITAIGHSKQSNSGSDDSCEDRAGRSSSARDDAAVRNNNDSGDTREKQTACRDDEQLGQLPDRDTQVLVILTRAHGRNDALMEELFQRQNISLRITTYKNLVPKKGDEQFHQQRIRQCQVSRKQQQSLSKEIGVTPVEVVEVPLLETQVAEGIFKREQQRLVAALVQLQQHQGEHRSTQLPTAAAAIF